MISTQSVTRFLMAIVLYSGRCDAERFWSGSELAGQEMQAVPASDLRYDSLASQ